MADESDQVKQPGLQDEPSLRRVAARYTALRVGVFAVIYVVAAGVLVPSVGSRSGWLDAGLVAVVASIPISYRLGRPMREAVTEAIDARRAASREKDADDAARVQAARDRRQPRS